MGHREERVAELLQGIGLRTSGEEVIIIRQNGEVDQCKVYVEGGFGRIILRKQTLYRTHVSKLTFNWIGRMRKSLTNILNEKIRAGLKKGITESTQSYLRTVFTSVQGTVMQQFHQELQSIAGNVDKDADSYMEAKKLLQDVTDGVLKKFKRQELEQKIPELVSEIVQKRSVAFASGIEITNGSHDAAQETITFSSEWFVAPKGTRYLAQQGPNTVVIVESEPQTRTVSTNKNFRHLAFPRMLFMVTLYEKKFKTLRVYFVDSPLATLARKVGRVPLGYINPENGRVHTCQFGMYMSKESSSLAEVVDDVIRVFWNSMFSGSFLAPIYIDHRAISGYEQWEKCSRENPDFSTEVTFDHCDRNLNEYVDQELFASFDGIRNQEIFSKFVNQVTHEVKEEVKKYCEDVSTTERFVPQNVRALDQQLTILKKSEIDQIMVKCSALAHQATKDVPAEYVTGLCEKLTEVIANGFVTQQDLSDWHDTFPVSPAFFNNAGKTPTNRREN